MITVRIASGQRRLVAISAAMTAAGILLALSIVGCSSSPTNSNSSGGSGVQSQARVYAQGVHVTLDLNTVEDMLGQMTTNMAPEVSRTPAGYREYLWKFLDGSSLLFSFYAAGGERSGQGLVLHHIQINDR